MLSMVCHNESPILLLNHWIRGLFALYNVLCEARVCLLLLLNLSDKPLGGAESGGGGCLCVFSWTALRQMCGLPVKKQRPVVPI